VTDEPYDVKVEYVLLSGYSSTAYLDRRDGDTATGVNKYTDEPVTVRWGGVRWTEIDPGAVA
jgi:hypothetical protein